MALTAGVAGCLGDDTDDHQDDDDTDDEDDPADENGDADPPEFTIDAISPEDITVRIGEPIAQITADIINITDGEGTQTIELRIEDEVVREESLTMSGFDQKTVTFTDIALDDAEAGQYEFSIATETSEMSGSLAIEPLPDILMRIEDLDPFNVTFDEPGDEVTVSATVRNVSFDEESQVVEYRVAGEVFFDETVALEGEAESTIEHTITYSDVEAQLGTGEFEHGFFSEDDSQTGILTLAAAHDEKGKLAMHLPLDGDSPVDEVSGEEGEIHGVVTTGAEGMVDEAFEFDGESGAVVFEDSPLNETYVTLTCWFTYAEKQDWARILQVGGGLDAEPEEGWSLEFVGDSDTLSVTSWGDEKIRPAQIDLASDVWYYSAVVWDEEIVRWHVFDEDGELPSSPVIEEQSRNYSDEQPLHLMGADGAHTAGRMDDVHGFTYALSESEVLQQYQQTAPVGYDDYLVTHLPLDGDSPVDVVTGNEGSIYGDVQTEVAGMVGQAFEFDGESGAVVLEDTPLNPEFVSVSAWFMTTGKQDWARVVQVGGSLNDEPDDGWSLEFVDGTDTLSVTSWGDEKVRPAQVELEDDDWYFTVVVWDREDVRWHIFDEDGELDDSPVIESQSRNATEAGPLNIMAADDWFTAGRIDDIRGYHYLLSAEDVVDLYDELSSE